MLRLFSVALSHSRLHCAWARSKHYPACLHCYIFKMSSILLVFLITLFFFEANSFQLETQSTVYSSNSDSYDDNSDLAIVHWDSIKK